MNKTTMLALLVALAGLISTDAIVAQDNGLKIYNLYLRQLET